MCHQLNYGIINKLFSIVSTSDLFNHMRESIYPTVSSLTLPLDDGSPNRLCWVSVSSCDWGNSYYRGTRNNSPLLIIACGRLLDMCWEKFRRLESWFGHEKSCCDALETCSLNGIVVPVSSVNFGLSWLLIETTVVCVSILEAEGCREIEWELLNFKEKDRRL